MWSFVKLDVNLSVGVQVIHPKKDLERWIVSAVRHFRRTANNAVIEEAHSVLMSLLKSLRSFTPLDLELATLEELDVQPPLNEEEEKPQSRPFYSRFSRPAEQPSGPWSEPRAFSKEHTEYGKEVDYKPMDYSNELTERNRWSGHPAQPAYMENSPAEKSIDPSNATALPTEAETWGREKEYTSLPAGVEQPKQAEEPVSNWEGKISQPPNSWEPSPGGWGSGGPVARGYEPGPPNDFVNYKPPNESASWSSRDRDHGNNGDFSRREPDVPTVWPAPSNWRSGARPPQDATELEKSAGSDMEGWGKGQDFGNEGSRTEVNPGGSALLPSPQQPSTPHSQISSPNQVGWYSDGDPAAMDVFAASPHLYIGSISPAVTETIIRFHFEKFGPIDGVSRVRDCAVIDFRNIRDAVKARELMQGYMLNGKSIHIKFVESSGHTNRAASNPGAFVPGCHVWVGGISSQSAKEELLKDVGGAGLKGPRSVFALVSASAIILEFEAPEDAAAVMVHVRQRRKEGGGPHLPPSKTISEWNLQANMNLPSDGLSPAGNRHLWIGRVDPLIHEDDILSAFSHYGELTGWKFLRQSGCCFIDFRYGMNPFEFQYAIF